MRHSEYDEQKAEEIIESLTNGQSFRQIAEQTGISRSTIARWMAANPDFDTAIARARELQADHMDDLILETANNCTNETALSDKVKIWAYQWRAAKLRPKSYGDKTSVDHTGTVRVEQVEWTVIEAQARLS